MNWKLSKDNANHPVGCASLGADCWMVLHKESRLVGKVSQLKDMKDMSGTTSIRFRQYREFIEYLREHPTTWHIRYAVVFRVIRLTGVLAFVMFGIGVLLLIFADVLQ